MVQKTLAEEIIILVKDHANNNPAPTQCTVINNYEDDQYHVDVSTEDGTLRYVPCLFSNTVGADGIIVYLDGDLNTPLAIIDTRSE